MVSCIVSLISFIPNTKSRPDKNEIENTGEKNLLFYGDIASIGTIEEYIKLSINKYFSNEEMDIVNELVYDLASEVLINSRITVKKYKNFKNAVKIDFIALVMTIIFFCVA